MTCPNCGAEMQVSNFVIDTYPETYEHYCSCGAIVDVSEGYRHMCSSSRLTAEQIAMCSAKLEAKPK